MNPDYILVEAVDKTRGYFPMMRTLERVLRVQLEDIEAKRYHHSEVKGDAILWFMTRQQPQDWKQNDDSQSRNRTSHCAHHLRKNHPLQNP